MNTLDLTLLDALVARAAEPVGAIDLPGLASRLRRADSAVRIRQAACVGVGIAAGALVVVGQGGDSGTRVDTQVPAADRPYTGTDPELPVITAAPTPTVPLDSLNAAPVADAPAPADLSHNGAANDVAPHDPGPAVPPGGAPPVQHDPPPTTRPPNQGAFTARQYWGSCDSFPPYEEFDGTAAPHATVTASSPYGTQLAIADAEGHWYLQIFFPTAPVNEEFTITVSSGGASQSFLFTRTG